MKKKIILTITNLNFTAEILDKSLHPFIDAVKSYLLTYKYQYNRQYKKVIRIVDRGYYVTIPEIDTHIFTINIIKDFMSLLSNYVKREEIEIINNKKVIAKKLNLKFNKKFKPRDYQKEYIKILTDKEQPNMLLVDLSTGYGKTFIAMASVVKLNYRTGIVILPKYIEKWIDDVKKYTDVKDEEIYVVQGTDSLYNIMNETNIEYKFIIFSMRTLYNYFKSYEETGTSEFIEPSNLMKHLGIGTIINDEAHQEFYTVFRTTLFFNVYKYISLSATLDSNQKDIKNIYNILFPKDSRISNIVKYEPYIKVIAVNYRMNNTRGIKYKRPQGYSHNLFEQSIMLNSLFLRDYIDMINYYVIAGYIAKREDGDKCIIFASSIRMCTIITNYLQDQHKSLDVRRYVEDDPYENVMEADITVSTVLSSGTALDIPNLITVIQTISISSLQANIQAVGRLRKLEEKETEYYYLYSSNISNQVKMHHDRKKAIKHMAKEYKQVEYPKIIRTK